MISFHVTVILAVSSNFVVVIHSFIQQFCLLTAAIIHTLRYIALWIMNGANNTRYYKRKLSHYSVKAKGHVRTRMSTSFPWKSALLVRLSPFFPDTFTLSFLFIIRTREGANPGARLSGTRHMKIQDWEQHLLAGVVLRIRTGEWSRVMIMSCHRFTRKQDCLYSAYMISLSKHLSGSVCGRRGSVWKVGVEMKMHSGTGKWDGLVRFTYTVQQRLSKTAEIHIFLFNFPEQGCARLFTEASDGSAEI